jgi:peptidyl-prolyl cis-trans isomerase C
MKSAILMCVVGAFLYVGAASAFAADDDAKAALAKPYVTVNGTVQTNARAEILLREQIARGVQDSQQLRAGVRDIIIKQALMEQEARKAGLDKEVLVQAQIDLARQNILALAWQQKVLSEFKIKDDDLKAEYDIQIARLGQGIPDPPSVGRRGIDGKTFNRENPVRFQDRRPRQGVLA